MKADGTIYVAKCSQINPHKTLVIITMLVCMYIQQGASNLTYVYMYVRTYHTYKHLCMHTCICSIPILYNDNFEMVSFTKVSKINSDF